MLTQLLELEATQLELVDEQCGVHVVVGPERRPVHAAQVGQATGDPPGLVVECIGAAIRETVVDAVVTERCGRLGVAFEELVEHGAGQARVGHRVRLV